MTTMDHAISGALAAHGKGPVTAARQRRTALIYTAMCLVGFTPVLAGAPAGWQAAGLGLWLPGAGFLAVGGVAALLFPLTIALFGLPLIAWFWAGWSSRRSPCGSAAHSSPRP